MRTVLALMHDNPYEFIVWLNSAKLSKRQKEILQSVGVDADTLPDVSEFLGDGKLLDEYIRKEGPW